MNQRGEHPVGVASNACWLMLPLCLVLALLSSGCRRDHASSCTQGSDPSAVIRTAAEQALRAGNPKLAVQFRGVRLYAQAASSHWAVCGLMTPFADDPGIFVPFVSLLAPTTRPGSRYEIEQYVGTTTAEADRVYIAMVADCWDDGGPSTGPLQDTTPLPPLPDAVREPEAHASTIVRGPPSPRTTVAVVPSVDRGTQAVGRAVMRQNANLHAWPHGPPVHVVQQGAALRIFAAAPGGWYQVGETSPWGWVHESMITLQ